MKSLLISFFLCSSLSSYAQNDTLRLTLPQAEAQFLQKNFVLLAQKYNVNIAEAAVQQAKLWYNPNLFVETNLYNGFSGRLLPYGKNTDLCNPTAGVFNVQVQQIVSLTKQRSKLVQLAETNRKVAFFVHDAQRSPPTIPSLFDV